MGRILIPGEFENRPKPQPLPPVQAFVVQAGVWAQAIETTVTSRAKPSDYALLLEQQLAQFRSLCREFARIATDGDAALRETLEGHKQRVRELTGRNLT